MDADMREVVKRWLRGVEAWRQAFGFTHAEILEVWEEVTPTTPDQPGST